MLKPAMQICAVHQELITQIANSRRTGVLTDSATTLIEKYENDGWVKLAHVLNAWLNGAEPDLALLDEEDQEIIKGIDYATAHPEWIDSVADEAREEAAQGIAQLIFAATWGDQSALELISNMREAASDVGIKKSAAHAFVAIVEGARDANDIESRFTEADPLLIRAVIARLTALEKE